MRSSGARLEQAPRLLGRCAFFLDIDGTLLDIADHPDLIRVDGELLGLLESLGRAAGGALALISGRSVEDIDTLLAGSRFCVAGQHGAERRDFSGTMHRREVSRAALETARRRLAAVAARHPALVLEDKGVNFAVHFRSAPELAEQTRDEVRDLARELGGEFEVQLGKMVVELRPAGKDKGVAISEFLAEEPFRGRSPVFVGDDLTDEIGFELINRVGGHSVKVGPGRSSARWGLADAGAVRKWLADFVGHAGGGS
jgi:trehalose 6-phosphate phosphatase